MLNQQQTHVIGVQAGINGRVSMLASGLLRAEVRDRGRKEKLAQRATR
jgi:hypothetical protein